MKGCRKKNRVQCHLPPPTLNTPLYNKKVLTLRPSPPWLPRGPSPRPGLNKIIYLSTFQKKGSPISFAQLVNKCDCPPTRKLWQTDQLTERPNDRPTTDRLDHGEVTLPTRQSQLSLLKILQSVRIGLLYKKHNLENSIKSILWYYKYRISVYFKDEKKAPMGYEVQFQQTFNLKYRGERHR